jgi:hypothetical protein
VWSVSEHAHHVVRPSSDGTYKRHNTSHHFSAGSTREHQKVTRWNICNRKTCANFCWWWDSKPGPSAWQASALSLEIFTRWNICNLGSSISIAWESLDSLRGWKLNLPDQTENNKCYKNINNQTENKVYWHQSRV